jgi:molecular chaperone DnaJ
MNLYALLGVSRDASPDDIERAYRRLARRYHPGINPGDPVAEETYRQVQYAHGVLGNAERRRDYDRGVVPGPVAQMETTVSFSSFDLSAPAEGPLAATFSELFADVFQDAAREATTPTRGADMEITLSLSFDQATRGGQFPVSVTRQERCVTCASSGQVARAPVPCPGCGGRGSVQWARGHMVFTKACERCGGGGRLSTEPCRACRGLGVQPRNEVATLTVPPGTDDGARLVVPGRGHAGARGGPAGDLYVTVSVAGHPFFRKVGRDLHLTLPVAVHEAALGARVEVPTLDGPVRLRIPPGTPSGQRLRLRGHGVPSRLGAKKGEGGDLLVEVQIVLPPVRDERSKALLREFGELNDVNVRGHLFEAR